MPIVQVPLDVPDDIYAGVLNGTLELMGLAKDSHHKVRKHIARANVPKVNKAAQAKKVGVLQVVKEHKVMAIGVAVVAAAAGAGAYAFHSIKERKKEAAEERVVGFQKALKENLKALEELELKKLGKDIELTIPASQLTALIFSIFTYTQSLAEANSFDVEISKPKAGTKGNIISLKSYLEIQKQILESAA